jgi:hypothetical protein
MIPPQRKAMKKAAIITFVLRPLLLIASPLFGRINAHQIPLRVEAIGKRVRLPECHRILYELTGWVPEGRTNDF